MGDGQPLTVSVHQAFLKSKDEERRLDQLKGQLQRGGEQVPPQQHSEFTDWLKEQQEEVSTFRAHCHTRQKQMESLLCNLNRCVVCVCGCLLPSSPSRKWHL